MARTAPSAQGFCLLGQEQKMFRSGYARTASTPESGSMGKCRPIRKVKEDAPSGSRSVATTSPPAAEMSADQEPAPAPISTSGESLSSAASTSAQGME